MIVRIILVIHFVVSLSAGAYDVPVLKVEVQFPHKLDACSTKEDDGPPVPPPPPTLSGMVWDMASNCNSVSVIVLVHGTISYK